MENFCVLKNLWLRRQVFFFYICFLEIFVFKSWEFNTKLNILYIFLSKLKIHKNQSIEKNDKNILKFHLR